jgi:hypothetical protein
MRVALTFHWISLITGRRQYIGYYPTRFRNNGLPAISDAIAIAITAFLRAITAFRRILKRLKVVTYPIFIPILKPSRRKRKTSLINITNSIGALTRFSRCGVNTSYIYARSIRVWSPRIWTARGGLLYPIRVCSEKIEAFPKGHQERPTDHGV